MRLIIILLLLNITGNLYSQKPGRNFHFRNSIILDNVINFKGGIEKDFATLALFDFSIDYEPFDKGMMNNVSLHAHILKSAGRPPSEKFIGDIQISSNIEGKTTRFLYELLVKLNLGNVNIITGLHDLNTEFMVSDFAGDFINSSFGIFPVITLNNPVSIYPVTSFGSIISYERQSLSIAAGIYNLNHAFVYEESFSMKNHFFQKGYLGVGELRYRWFDTDSRINAKYKLGAYMKRCVHNADPDYDDYCLSENNYGFYFIGDQLITHFRNGGVLGAFLQVGMAPEEINFASHYFGSGITISGKNPLSQKTGIAFARVKLNDYSDSDLKRKNYETVVEITARKNILKNICLQPDFQFIINPSGILPDAFVGNLRVLIEIE